MSDSREALHNEMTDLRFNRERKTPNYTNDCAKLLMAFSLQKPPCPTNDSTKSPLTSKEHRDIDSPIKGSESEGSISASCHGNPAFIPCQASRKKPEQSGVKAATWSGYKLMCSLRRYINECDVLDTKPHNIESYADYIILHDHPPPRRAAAARKKRRKDAIGATEMTGGKALPPSAHFKQYSNNTSVQWKELEDEEREQYKRAAKKINKLLVESRERYLKGV